MQDLVRPISGCTVLDLGCGTGRHAFAFANQGARVIALDQSEAMLARATAKSGADRIGWVRHALPARLPFADRTLDVVVMGLVCEHVPRLEIVFADIARVLRVGARCVLSVLHPDRTAEGQRARFIEPETGVRRPIITIHRSKDDYRRLASEAGWHLRESRDLVVPPSLVETHPRAAKYVGKPLGWVACWES